MTPTQQAEWARRIAAQAMALETELDAFLRAIDDDARDELEPHAHAIVSVRDAMELHAETLAPLPFLPTLFQWKDGLTRRVGQ